VATAHDGYAAIEAAQTFCPDVVLLDLNLPGLDGWEVARRLRRIPATAGALLVAVTGYGGEHEHLRTEEAGFDRHFTKPVDPSVLWGLLGGEEG
jgi:CheY-like chemotaxis protein